jgi:2-polyprenyl-6-methoxyphenol hydroxylase-like FAD-dependent oxidoreductase
LSDVVDAIIIGAGPAGSTAAILLAQAGWSVALVEKQTFPRRKVCGECIAAPNLPLLERLGITEAFDGLTGEDLRQVALMLGKKTITADLPALSDSRYAWGRAIGREHLDSLLLEKAAAAGARILQPWTVKSISGSLGHYVCEIASASVYVPDEVRRLVSPIVIAACGSWERQSFMHEEKPSHRPGDLFAFKANFHNSRLQPGLLPVLAFAGGYGGMVLCGDNVMTLACCIRRDALQDCRLRFSRRTAAESVEAYLRASCAGVEQALEQAERQGSWLSVGPLQPGIRLHKAQHEFFLIGNAAAEAHPIIGEGISMAMQSAWLLCDKLIAQGKGKTQSAAAWRQTRKTYIHAWRRNFTLRLRLAAMFAHLAMRPRWSAALLPLLQRWPEAITKGAFLSGKARPLLHEQLQREMP